MHIGQWRESYVPHIVQQRSVHDATYTATWSPAVQTPPNDGLSSPGQFLSTTPENQSWNYMHNNSIEISEFAYEAFVL